MPGGSRNCLGLPYWLTDAIADSGLPDNVRKLRNLAERIGLTERQPGTWDAVRRQRLLTLARNGRPAPGWERGRSRDRTQQVGMNECHRVLAALNANGWRREDTAQYLGISREVLWEKMRKYQIFDEEPETRETE